MTAQRQQLGRTAEDLVATRLVAVHWEILERNARTRYGELDIVALDGRTLVFVEVKARAGAAEADLALDEYRLRRVIRAAEVLVPRYARDGDTVRVDAMFIIPWRLPRHMMNISLG